MTVILETLQEKYRVIRDRFKSNFIAIGQGPGMSMPYSIRNNSLFWYNYHYSGYYHDVKKESEQKYSNDQDRENYFFAQTGTRYGACISQGDGTVGMGFYLAMLATEYALLEKTSSTSIHHKRALADEIYYALEAMKRLDKKAFEVLGYQSNGYGGYFLRDDMPTDFYNKAPKTGNAGSGMLDNDLGGVVSDFINPSKENNFSDYINDLSVFMSQDQVFFVFMGLALMKRFLPPTLKSQHSNEPLIDIVKKIARGITVRYKNCGWVITAPNGTKNTKAGDTAAAGYAYPLALAGKYIFGDLLIDPFMIPLRKAWWGMAGQTFSAMDANNRKMVEILNALSNNNGIGASINRSTAPNNLRAIFPLIQILLYSCPVPSNKKQDLKEHLTELLLSCPYFSCKAGGANSVHIPDTQSVKGWMNGNRWVHNGVDELEKDKNNNQATLHNGMDYMLAYNLYHLYFYENEPFSSIRRNSDPAVRMKFSIRGQMPTPAIFHIFGGFNVLIPPSKDALHYSPTKDGIFYRGYDDILYFAKFNNANNTWSAEPLIAGYKVTTSHVFYQVDKGKIYFIGSDRKWYNYYVHQNKWHAGCLHNDVNNATGDAVFDHPNGTIYYRGTDNTLNRLKWESSGWVHTVIRPDVKTVAGELLLGPGKVHYKSQAGHFMQMMVHNGSWHSWGTNDSGVAIKDNLMYIPAPYDQFIYRGTDRNLHSIFFEQGTWKYAKIPYGQGNIAGTIKYAPATKTIFYLENDDKIVLMYKINNNWHHKRLTLAVKIKGDFHLSADGNTIFFVGEDHRLYKYYFIAGSATQWNLRTVNATEYDIHSIIGFDKTGDRLYLRSLDNGKIMFQY